MNQFERDVLETKLRGHNKPEWLIGPALHLSLTDEEIALIEALYHPHQQGISLGDTLILVLLKRLVDGNAKETAAA